MLRNGIRNILFSIMKILSYLIPKKKGLWVFGSWFGKQYSDNSKYIFEYICQNKKEINSVWITKNEDIKKELDNCGYKCLRYDSIKAILTLLRAEVVFMTQSYEDLSSIFFIGASYQVQLWHGVAFKKIGFDRDNKNISLIKMINKSLYKFWSTASLYIAPSNEYKSKLISAFEVEPTLVLEVGQPRNVILSQNNKGNVKKIKEKFEKLYNVQLNNRKVITYMPTFRDSGDKVFSFTDLNIEQSNFLDEILKESIIIEKSHFVSNKSESKDKNIITINNCDTQELLLITDLLITDYSSCFFDFLILDKPIIHYIYDYDFYKNEDRGLYYDINEIKCGDIAYNFEELLVCINDNINSKLIKDYSRLRNDVRSRFITFENRNNFIKLIDFIRVNIQRVGK